MFSHLLLQVLQNLVSTCNMRCCPGWILLGIAFSLCFHVYALHCTFEFYAIKRRCRYSCVLVADSVGCSSPSGLPRVSPLILTRLFIVARHSHCARNHDTRRRNL